jgi:hypothetical protein
MLIVLVGWLPISAKKRAKYNAFCQLLPVEYVPGSTVNNQCNISFWAPGNMFHFPRNYCRVLQPRVNSRMQEYLPGLSRTIHMAPIVIIPRLIQ